MGFFGKIGHTVGHAAKKTGGFIKKGAVGLVDGFGGAIKRAPKAIKDATKWAGEEATEISKAVTKPVSEGQRNLTEGAIGGITGGLGENLGGTLMLGGAALVALYVVTR